MDNGAITERLRVLIDDALVACGREPSDVSLSDDAFLPEFLDSVVLSALIVHIEDEWDFEIADEEIEPELFETLGALSRFVGSKLR